METIKIQSITENLDNFTIVELKPLLPFKIKDGFELLTETGLDFTYDNSIILGRAYEGKVYFTIPINNKGREYDIAPVHFILDSDVLEPFSIYTPEFKEDECEMMYNTGFYNEGLKQIVEDNRKDTTEDEPVSKLKGLAGIFEKKPSYTRKLYFRFKKNNQFVLYPIDPANKVEKIQYEFIAGNTIFEGRCKPMEGITACHYRVVTVDLEKLKKEAVDNRGNFNEDIYYALIQKHSFVYDNIIETSKLELVNIEDKTLFKYREYFEKGITISI